ncbi:DoxX family protein [Ramlibacter sp. PS4R-6]|uniref:DoxX family protein n=1 Tax=Ramlibacter sp. PS4R-6 TaxID=3133438 RepID=UPI0030990E65
MTRSSQLPGAAPFAGRLLLASLFLLSGVAKLADPAGTQAYIASSGAPFPQAGYAIAVLVEVVGGAMLLAGYRTRLAALVLGAFTLAAAALFHNQLSDQLQFIMFMKNVAITGGLLQVAAFGPGWFSIDNRSASPALARA